MDNFNIHIDPLVTNHSGEHITVDVIEFADRESIDDAYAEFGYVYQERLPYVLIPTLNGNCYRWNEIFIFGVRMAMSTDKLIQFTTDELEAWWNFVNFQNYHTHSALTTDCNGFSVGCTIPDEYNKSYSVCKDGKISDIECQDPTFEVLNEDIWKSLDKLLMDLYNCNEVDDCDRTKELLDVSPCLIAP